MRSFSIVINTYNRCKTLRDTLASLARLDYPRYEVIVVNGPSTDGTDDLLAEYEGAIKLVSCPVRSLSVSRNLGIRASAGEIIAFLDDDAVADPRWLHALAKEFDDPQVGAVGGFVYDHTGYDYQCKYNLLDRFGKPQVVETLDDPDQYTRPGCLVTLSTMGTNTAFRATDLLQVGGFDEAFIYYLDETDVCVRMIDAGYKIRISPDALIYHRYAASFARTAEKIPTTLYPSSVSHAYFLCRFGLQAANMSRVFDEMLAFQGMLSRANDWLAAHGKITREKERELNEDVVRGFQDGMRKALRAERSLIPVNARHPHAEFHPFPARVSPPVDGKMRLCLVADCYPPAHVGGVARWTHDLAVGLDALGHEVHVLTLGGERNTVDYENGVFVHRLVPNYKPEAAARLPVDVPTSAAAGMIAIYDEIKRMQAEAPIDIVAWHVWENLGLAAMHDPSFHKAMFIESGFETIRPYKPQWQITTQFGRDHVEKMVQAERYAYRNAPVVIAPSNLIVGEYDDHIGVPREGHTVVIPLGTADPGELPVVKRANGTVEVLYVGRLENRKGIGMLLEVIPDLCRQFPKLRFRICGEDIAESTDGPSPRVAFEQAHAGASFWPQVIFTGKVSDAELARYYASCDVFVAPSRFESFGLIFIEAMARGKPVVALAAGGATEIVRHEIDGFLADPDDASSLAEGIARMVKEPEFRLAAGRAARERYLDRFTIPSMAEQTAKVFQQLRGQTSSTEEELPSLPLNRPSGTKRVLPRAS